MSPRHRTRKGGRRRNGVAAVEFAICLPPLIVLMFGSIEACNAIFLDNSTLIVAYEGVREAIKPDATNALVEARCDEILTSRNIQSPVVTLNPADIGAANRGEKITITVSAPCDENSVLPSWFFAGRPVSSSVTMVKE